MGSDFYYNIFRRCVEWGVRILIISLSLWFFTSISSKSPGTLFVLISIGLALVEIFYWILTEEWFLSDLSDNLFDALYELDFEDYVYSIKEVIYNDGKTYYFPMVKTIKHFPTFYIRDDGNQSEDDIDCYGSQSEDDIDYWLSRLPGPKKDKKEDAIFVIEKYKEQIINERNRKHGNKVKAVNIINVIYK